MYVPSALESRPVTELQFPVPKVAFRSPEVLGEAKVSHGFPYLFPGQSTKGIDDVRGNRQRHPALRRNRLHEGLDANNSVNGRPSLTEPILLLVEPWNLPGQVLDEAVSDDPFEKLFRLVQQANRPVCGRDCSSARLGEDQLSSPPDRGGELLLPEAAAE